MLSTTASESSATILRSLDWVVVRTVAFLRETVSVRSPVLCSTSRYDVPLHEVARADDYSFRVELANER
jgi:hypothetical protein